jgi:Flp pilus assembly protein CpaB
VAYWSLTVLLALATAWSITQAQARARQAEARWDVVAAPVAAHALAAGTVLGPDDVTIVELPAVAVPAATGAALDPAGRTLRHDVAAGELLLDARLAPAGVTGPAAGLASDEVGVSLARTTTTPPVAEGDRVDIVVGRDPFGAGIAEVTLAVRDAAVLAVQDDAVTVAVPRADAPAILAATRDGFAELVLSGA